MISPSSLSDSVLVAMSGGVDSSLSAALLARQGRPIIGVTMKTFCYSGDEGPSRTCCGLDGIADAKSVAAQLDMPHFVFDVEEDFTRDVIDDFVAEYAAGRTPIPCVRCNSFTKFRDLVSRADSLGCGWLATGHYARVVRPVDRAAELHRAADERKDQTYFLWGIPRSALDRLLLPVGDLTKSEGSGGSSAAGSRHRRKTRVLRDLLRTGQRLRRRSPAVSGRRPPRPLQRQLPVRGWHGGGGAPGVCALHRRAAKASSRRLHRTDVRHRDTPRVTRGGYRAPGVSRPFAGGGSERELARRHSRDRRATRGADPARRRNRRGGRDRGHARRVRARAAGATVRDHARTERGPLSAKRSRGRRSDHARSIGMTLSAIAEALSTSGLLPRPAA